MMGDIADKIKVYHLVAGAGILYILLNIIKTFIWLDLGWRAFVSHGGTPCAYIGIHINDAMVATRDFTFSQWLTGPVDTCMAWGWTYPQFGIILIIVAILLWRYKI